MSVSTKGWLKAAVVLVAAAGLTVSAGLSAAYAGDADAPIRIVTGATVLPVPDGAAPLSPEPESSPEPKATPSPGMFYAHFGGM
ncbi:hypothetical protein ACQP25_16910 [Microtetraspora malaysiensis]|uniref:hypothetical protein n=1 Tax=Microtetraspora malaysiensis TaxID=161358 RepID=UPI003D8EB905